MSIVGKKIYIATNKETGELMVGAKGQHAFSDPSSLAKSIGQQFWYQKEAKEKGVRPRDLYDIFEVDVLQAISFGGKKI